MEGEVTFASEPDRASWMPRGVGAAADLAAYADAAYQLRFALGPTVSEETLERVRDRHAAEAVFLLAEGVDPRLLGLAG